MDALVWLLTGGWLLHLHQNNSDDYEIIGEIGGDVRVARRGRTLDEVVANFTESAKQYERDENERIAQGPIVNAVIDKIATLSHSSNPETRARYLKKLNERIAEK